MLETILKGQIWLVLLGMLVVIGVVSKGVVTISLRRLTKAAGNMNKSSHELMKLVRAKYEHACMVSDKVQNVTVFVEKFLYEYKIAGIRLHGWRRLERISAWGCGILGLGVAAGRYYIAGMGESVLRGAVLGLSMGILLFLLRMSMDESYYLRMIRTYMMDYLDNVCARKYEKTRRQELKERRMEETAPNTAEEIIKEAARLTANKEMPSEDAEKAEKAEKPARPAKISRIERKVMEREAENREAGSEKADFQKKEEKVPDEPIGEVRIRQILEEFLA